MAYMCRKCLNRIRWLAGALVNDKNIYTAHDLDGTLHDETCPHRPPSEAVFDEPAIGLPL